MTSVEPCTGSWLLRPPRIAHRSRCGACLFFVASGYQHELGDIVRHDWATAATATREAIAR